MARQPLFESDGSVVVISAGASKYISVTLGVTVSIAGNTSSVPIDTSAGGNASVTASAFSDRSGIIPLTITDNGSGLFIVRFTPSDSESLAKNLPAGTERAATLVITASISGDLNGTMYTAGDALSYEFGFKIRRII